MEDFPTSQAVRFAPCKHPFCQECARAYVFSKVEAKQLPILCPMCMTEPNRPAKKTGGTGLIIYLMALGANLARSAG